MAEEKKAGAREGDEGDRLSRSERIVQNYLTRREAGEDVDTEEFLRMYPELEAELLNLFDKIRNKVIPAGDLFSPSKDESEDHKGSKILGDFRILKEIGSGGMATVHEAEQISLKRKVALKILPSHLSFSDDAVSKFRREAEAGGRQTHSGIVAIYATGEYEGLHYIAEELVEDGYTLADRLDELREEEGQPIGYFREAANLIVEVTDALQHAHAAGVIHRDIKPSNILLTPEGKPKVTDFGLARIEDALNLSRTGDFAGTPFYMSPEQAMSRRIGIDHRTDIYSLGVTLYETLVLSRPFDGDTSHEILKNIIFKEPSDPRKLNSRVPRDLAMICLKSLEKEPARRYQTMEEFGEDLKRFLNGEVVLAKPSGRLYKASKWIKRNRVLSAAGGLVLLLLVVFLLHLGWSASRILKERGRAAAIHDILVNVLFSADPTDLGRDVTMLEALDNAVLKITDSPPKDPEVEAEVRDIIGTIYQRLGRYDDAVKQHGKAIKIWEHVLGEEHIKTLNSKNEKSVSLLHSGKLSEAESLCREAYPLWCKQVGDEDERTLMCRDNLAAAQYKLGRFEEAEKHYQDILNIRRRIMKDSDPATLTSMNNLACVFLKQKKLADAEALYEEVLENRRDKLGNEDPATLRSMVNLASFNLKLEKFSEAEELLEKALDIQRNKLTEKHSDTLATMNKLALVWDNQGKDGDAEALYIKTLEGRTNVLGFQHRDTLESKNNLATFYINMGKYSKAEPLLDEVMTALDDKPNETYPDMFIWMDNLAYACVKMNKNDKAKELYRKIIQGRAGLFGDSDVELIHARIKFASALWKFEEYSDAEEVMKNGEEAVSIVFEKKDSLRIEFHRLYGIILLVQGKNYKKAEEQLKARYVGLKEAYGVRNEKTRDAIYDLIKLCKKWNKPEKKKHYEKLLNESKNRPKQ